MSALIFQPLNDLLGIKGFGGRLAGLDIGDRTIGIAVSDLTWNIASPLKTIERSRGDSAQDIKNLLRIAAEEQFRGIVFGWPQQLSGTEGIQCLKVEEFAKLLRAEMVIPFFKWDERFSTSAVTRSLKSANLNHRRRKKVVDQMAAAFILQGVLDWLR